MRHSKAVWASLDQTVRLEDLDVVLIQEPPPYLEMMNHLWPGFRIALAAPSPAHAVIMYKENLGCTQCSFDGSRVCGIQMPFRGTFLTFISAYIRHTSGEGIVQLSNALAKASAMSPFVFVGMDSNGHSPLWGPAGTKLDRIGESVEEALCERGLLVLNDQDSPPTFCSDLGHSTWIDVSAASPALIPCAVDWAAREDVEVLSDHRLIVTQLLAQSRKPDVHVMRDWCKVEWDKFNALLWRTLDRSLLDRHLSDGDDVEDAVTSMTDTIQRVIDALVPLKRVCQYSRAGWTPELTRLRRRVTYTRRRWVRTGRVSAREEFLMTRRLFRTTLSRARAAAWRRLCEETSAPNFWSLYRRVRRGRGDQGVEPLQHGDQTITTDSRKVEIFAGVFFPKMPPQRTVE